MENIDKNLKNPPASIMLCHQGLKYAVCIPCREVRSAPSNKR